MENLEMSESDAEFWVELDKQVELIDVKTEKKPEVELKPNFEQEIQHFNITAPSNYYRERLEKLLNQARDAAKEHFRGKLIKSRQRLTKNFASKLSEVHSMYQLQISDLKKEFSAVNKKLIEKDFEISGLHQYIIDQELSISEFRVDKGNKYDEEKKVKDLIDTIQANKKGFDLQISHLKGVVKVYQKDSDNAISQLKALQQTFELKQHEFEMEKTRLTDEIHSVRAACNEKVEEIQEKYEYFKNDTTTELNIRYAINKRQIDFIEVLKKELKNAKLVLETPRINAKYLRKLGHRNMSLCPALEETTQKVPKKIRLQGLYQKNPTLSTSFSSSASPIYSNASELELISSFKHIDIIPESKYH